MKTSSRFRHDSLQDQSSISDLLTAITQGIEKGKIVLEDENGTITMEPSGLLRLKVSGSQEDEHNRLNIKITWQTDQNLPNSQNLKISHK
ncbi:amphi-Trp domain-containing protein [Terasakiella sp. SH-1]|uniref:amphi-Trp domain-containing protein n=1 Tax=Terasakiella sp. SH-1 TaxID=2560057 RepID=UPI0010730033|nr:amphi-Trp domain-containing protein [Terasakiella sp. SH-1]